MDGLAPPLSTLWVMTSLRGRDAPEPSDWMARRGEGALRCNPPWKRPKMSPRPKSCNAALGPRSRATLEPQVHPSVKVSSDRKATGPPKRRGLVRPWSHRSTQASRSRQTLEPQVHPSGEVLGDRKATGSPKRRGLGRPWSHRSTQAARSWGTLGALGLSGGRGDV